MSAKAFDRALAKLIAPLKRRVMLMVGRAVLTAVNDGTKVQAVQAKLNADEVGEDLERYQEYGLTSVPFVGSEGVVVFVGGNRAHGIVIATDDRTNRPKSLNPGDVCLYTDKGERVYLNRVDDILHLGAKAASDFVALAQKVDDNDQDMVTAYATHVHPTGTGPSGVTTNQPTNPVASTAAAKVKAT